MSHLTCSHRHIGSRPRSVISPHPIHACARGCLSVVFFLSFYLLSKSFFQPYLMSNSAPDEFSMEDPLCNSAIGSMVSLDYVTPDTVPVIDFRFFVNRGVFTDFHSNEYPCFGQSIWSNRTAGVASSDCTVTNRSKSWTKTCAYSFICTVSVAVSTDMGSLDLLREVSLLFEHKTLLLSIVLFSEQIPRYFAVTFCLSRGFLKCSFLKTGREGFPSWGSPFWIMPPDCPFLSQV